MQTEGVLLSVEENQSINAPMEHPQSSDRLGGHSGSPSTKITGLRASKSSIDYMVS